MRIVCLSDTHSLHQQVDVPDGDMLLHAGDLCNHGTKGEVRAFDAWLGRQPHRHKLFIAGNHDWPFYKHRRYAEMWVKHGTYLQDRAVMVEGLKIYGSPGSLPSITGPSILHWSGPVALTSNRRKTKDTRRRTT